jgi:hypothetical protein
MSFNIDELIASVIGETQEAPVATADDLMQYADDLVQKSSSIVIPVNDAPKLLLSKSLVQKKGYIPAAFGSLRQPGEMIHCSAIGVFGTILRVGEDGTFVECNNSRYGADTKAKTRTHVPFNSAKGVPTLVPDYGLIALMQRGEEALYQNAYSLPPYSPARAEQLAGQPAWSLRFTDLPSSTPSQETLEAWSNIRHDLAQQILKRGYNTLKLTPGTEVEAVITAFASLARYEPPSSEKKENGEPKYKTGIFGITLDAWFVYIAPLGSRQLAFNDDKLRAFSTVLNKQEIRSATEIATKAVQPDMPTVPVVQEPAISSRPTPTAAKSVESAQTPKVEMPESWKSLRPIVKAIVLHKLLSGNKEIGTLVLNFHANEPKEFTGNHLRSCKLDPKEVAELLSSRADDISAVAAPFADPLVIAKYADALKASRQSKKETAAPSSAEAPKSTASLFSKSKSEPAVTKTVAAEHSSVVEAVKPAPVSGLAALRKFAKTTSETPAVGEPAAPAPAEEHIASQDESLTSLLTSNSSGATSKSNPFKRQTSQVVVAESEKPAAQDNSLNDLLA